MTKSALSATQHVRANAAGAWRIWPTRARSTTRTTASVPPCFIIRAKMTTTMAVYTAAAGIDASMVMRYFGSKAGLFAADLSRMYTKFAELPR